MMRRRSRISTSYGNLSEPSDDELFNPPCRGPVDPRQQIRNLRARIDQLEQRNQQVLQRYHQLEQTNLLLQQSIEQLKERNKQLTLVRENEELFHSNLQLDRDSVLRAFFSSSTPRHRFPQQVDRDTHEQVVDPLAASQQVSLQLQAQIGQLRRQVLQLQQVRGFRYLRKSGNYPFPCVFFLIVRSLPEYNEGRVVGTVRKNRKYIYY